MDNPTAPIDALTSYRLEMVEKAISNLADNVTKLTGIEVKYHEQRDSMARVFSALEKHDIRLNVIETELPTLKLTRTWVIGGMTGLFSLNGAMILMLIKYLIPAA